MGQPNINIGEENVSKYLIYLTQLCVCVCVLSHVLFFEILWTVIHLAPVSGIFQERILDWVSISSSRRPSRPRD